MLVHITFSRRDGLGDVDLDSPTPTAAQGAGSGLVAIMRARETASA